MSARLAGLLYISGAGALTAGKLMPSSLSVFLLRSDGVSIVSLAIPSIYAAWRSALASVGMQSIKMEVLRHLSVGLMERCGVHAMLLSNQKAAMRQDLVLAYHVGKRSSVFIRIRTRSQLKSLC